MEDNRRQYFRVEANYRPLEGTLVIERVNGQAYNAKPVYILIADISAGGARIIANKWFPVDPSVVIRLQTEIDGLPFDFEGELLRSKKVRDGIYEFGLLFTNLDSKTRDKIIASLNHMVIAMRRVSVRLGHTQFTDRPELVRLFDYATKNRTTTE